MHLVIVMEILNIDLSIIITKAYLEDSRKDKMCGKGEIHVKGC